MIPAYSQALGDVRKALGDVADVQPCYWGEKHGAWLRANGASIPEYPTTRAIAELLADAPPESDDEYQVALWELLLADPLAELRLLASSGGPPRELGLNETAATLDLTRVAGWETLLPADHPLRPRIAESQLAPLLSEVCAAIQQTAAFNDVQTTADELTCRVAAARSIVASALCLAEEKEIASPARIDADLRDALVDDFVALLAEEARGVFDGARNFLRDYIKRPLAGLAARAATYGLRRKRGALSDVTMGVGAIFSFIREEAMPSAHSSGNVSKRLSHRWC